MAGLRLETAETSVILSAAQVGELLVNYKRDQPVAPTSGPWQRIVSLVNASAKAAPATPSTPVSRALANLVGARRTKLDERSVYPTGPAVGMTWNDGSEFRIMSRSGFERWYDDQSRERPLGGYGPQVFITVTPNKNGGSGLRFRKSIPTHPMAFYFAGDFRSRIPEHQTAFQRECEEFSITLEQIAASQKTL